MALVTKMTRCAVCGSSDVSFDGKTYHCATCGTDSDVSMPAADIAAVNRIVAMGNDAEEELPRLRRQYRNSTPRGRCATRAAYLHLGLTPPGTVADDNPRFDV